MGRSKRRRADTSSPEAALEAAAARSRREAASRSTPRRRRGAGIAPWTRRYLERTKHPAVNLVFLLPMLLVYLACRLTVGEEVETQAAESLRQLLRLLGRRTLSFALLATGVGLGAFAIARRRVAKADVAVFPAMLVEGLLYGILLGAVAQGLSRLLPVGRWLGVGLVPSLSVPGGVRGLGIAVGAGIFEELLFRGLLCYALFRVVKSVLGADRLSAGAVAVVASAFLFSAYHHWGPGGEPWDAVRFTFRFHAGVLLGVVFLTRGLGIAAFAHGFYDALVLLG